MRKIFLAEDTLKRKRGKNKGKKFLKEKIEEKFQRKGMVKNSKLL